MKRITSILLIAAILLCFFGCAELVKTETQEVDAIVTDVYYKKQWTQMIYTGKTIMPIVHRAQYRVTLTYENVTLTVDDKEFYDTYKDNIGATVKCILITESYDDGSIHRELKRKELNK